MLSLLLQILVSEEISEDDLKSKRSELRLYCDLLMQQVHSVKSSVTGENKQSPDIQVRMFLVVAVVFETKFMQSKIRLCYLCMLPYNRAAEK